MATDKKVVTSSVSLPETQRHRHLINDVLGLTEALLDKADIVTLESFKFLLESKANVEHRHDLSHLPGVRRDETLLDSFRSVVTALGSKANKIHGHSMRDIFSLQELKDYIKEIVYPKFTYSIHQRDDDIVFVTHLINSNGYYMPGVTFEYRKRYAGKRNWIHVDSKAFQFGTFEYSAICKNLNYTEVYECEIFIRDSLNPEFKMGSEMVTIHPVKKDDSFPQIN